MDLKAYYRRIRELESAMEEDFVVVRSSATEAGGKPGVLTEVQRGTAARMIVDGVAESAAPEEASEFRKSRAEAKEREDQRRAAERVQFRLLSEADLHALRRGSSRGGKKD